MCEIYHGNKPDKEIYFLYKSALYEKYEWVVYGVDRKKGAVSMEMLCKLQKKVPLLGIGVLIMMALLVSACGNQSSETSSLPTAVATPTAGSSTTASNTTTASETHVESSKPLTSIRMVSQSVGWAITQKATVLRTTDGGNHWMDVTPHYSVMPMEIMPTFADGQ